MIQKSKQTSKESGEDRSTDGIRVQLWTRRPVCGARTTVIDRLHSLESSGVIAGFDVETWPEEVVVDGGDDRIPSLFERLERWATDRGLTIQPPFDRRRVSPLIGEPREVLTLPVMTLVVETDGIAGVYPCSDGDRTWTVEDYLDSCAADGDAVPGPED